MAEAALTLMTLSVFACHPMSNDLRIFEVTKAELDELLDAQKHCCALSGCPFDFVLALPMLDYIVPLSKGGLPIIENMQYVTAFAKQTRGDRFVHVERAIDVAARDAHILWTLFADTREELDKLVEVNRQLEKPRDHLASFSARWVPESGD